MPRITKGSTVFGNGGGVASSLEARARVATGARLGLATEHCRARATETEGGEVLLAGTKASVSRSTKDRRSMLIDAAGPGWPRWSVCFDYFSSGG